MIRHLQHNEIDKARWDLCIDQSKAAIIYAQSWYLDIVSPEWNALVEDDYNVVFPLTWRKKWGILYLFQPPFTQQLGLFSRSDITEQKLNDFLNAIPQQYKLIEIQLNRSNSAAVIQPPFLSKERITHHLSLEAGTEQLEKNFSENTRRNIKRFEKTDFQLLEEIELIALVDLFRKNRGKDISQLGEYDYKLFIKLCEKAKAKKLFTSIGVNNSSGNLCGGIIFFLSQAGYILIFTGLSEEGKECGAMSALIGKFIKEHAGENRILDFEGSMDPGIARFYKSFGSGEIVYLQIRNNRLPRLLRWLKE